MDKSKNAKDKAITEANALSAMQESDGWKIIQDWLDEAVKLSKDEVFKPKKTKNWNDYLHYRATHNAYVKLLFMIENKIKAGVKATADQDNG